jgi:hypothetical protein
VSVADATSFPENFDLLHQQEEAIRGQTKEAIAASDTLRRHFAVVEASMTLLRHFSRDYPYNGEDELTVHLLGIRLFNSAAGAVQSLTSGYYQNCVMLQRDLVEVTFLLDYFRSNEDSISEWRRSPEKFTPDMVRKALDRRDGFNGLKRRDHYKLLSGIGTHASYRGFQLLTPMAGGDAHCGPYFANRVLEATVAELAQLCRSAAATFTRFFKVRSLLDDETNLSFMEATVTWSEHFIGPCEKGPLNALRARVARRRQG